MKQPEREPMTYAECLEFKARFDMEVRKLGTFMLPDLMRLPVKAPCFNRMLSHREAEYLDIIGQTVDDLF